MSKTKAGVVTNLSQKCLENETRAPPSSLIADDVVRTEIVSLSGMALYQWYDSPPMVAPVQKLPSPLPMSLGRP